MLVFSAQYAMLKRHGVARGWRLRLRASFTRGHVHAVVKLPRARPLVERVLLAALLGSDLKREGFNYIRILTGRRRQCPVAFFEPMKT